MTASRTAKVAAVALLASGIACDESRQTRFAAEGVIDVPFVFHRNQILLEIDVNSAGPFTVLLDTGGNPSLFDLKSALDAGLTVDTTRFGEAEGAGSEQVRIYALELSGVEIGDRGVGPIDAVAMDLSRISDRLGRQLHGVLGYSFLRDRIVQIDYPRRRLRVAAEGSSDPTTVGPSRGGQSLEIALILDGSDPILSDFMVNGSPLSVTLDTGSSLVLELYGADAAESVGLHASEGDSVSVHGARGEDWRSVTVADSLRLGPFLVRDAEVAVVHVGEEQEQDGNLGNGFLRDFVLTLDYVNGRLRLERPGGSR